MFECAHCHITFNKKFNLIIHIINIHMEKRGIKLTARKMNTDTEIN